MNYVTLVFLALLAAATVTRLWLAARQMRHARRQREVVPAAFAERIDMQSHRKAADYARANQRLAMTHALFAAVVAWAWTLGGGLAGVHAAGAALAGDTLWTALIGIAAVVIVSTLIELPLSAYRTFGLEQRFGFNRTTPGVFAADTVKGMILALLLTLPLAAIALWLIHSSSLWWLYFWLVWMAFMVGMNWAYPRLIAPLFNRFRPLEDAALSTRLEALLRRCGFSSEGVFVMDASRRSTHGNAYFSGLGRSKRVVLFDTLLEELDGDETEAVLAHELGHFRLGHIPRRVAMTAVTSLLALAALGWLIHQPVFYTGLGVPTPQPYLGLVLFAVAGPFATYFFTPLAAAYSRRHEYQADAFAIEHADGNALVRALVKFAARNASLVTADPVYSGFYHSHPPLAARVSVIEGAIEPGGGNRSADGHVAAAGS